MDGKAGMCMTLDELGQEYFETSERIYQRARRLRLRAVRCGDEDERRELERRVRIMMRMYRDTRKIAGHLRGYYDRSKARDEAYTI